MLSFGISCVKLSLLDNTYIVLKGKMNINRYYIYIFSCLVAICSWLSFYVGNEIEVVFNQKQAVIGGIWSMVTTIVVFQAIYEDTIQSGYQRIFGAFLGAIISIMICSIFGYGIIQMIFSIFLSLCAIKLINIDQTIRITAATAGVIAGHGLTTHSLTPWIDGSIRFLSTAIGAFIAIAGAYLLKILKAKCSS